MNQHSRRIGAGLGTSLAVVVLCATAGPRAAVQRAGGDAREHHVFITALSRNDVPVTDLTTKDVTVKEDGATREIVSVARATAPMQIELLADDSQAAMPLTTELRQGLSSFAALVSKSSPGTEISLWTFGERPTRVVDFTSSGTVLTNSINSLFPRQGAGSYFMEAMINVSTELKKHAATRPVIVAFLCEDSPEFSTATEQTVTSALKGAGAPLWAIVLEGRPNPTTTRDQGVQIERRDRDAILSAATEASGGASKVLLDRLGLESAYVAVASRLTSQLDVTYARPDRLVPPNKIDVTVSRPGVKVVAPRWAGQ